MKTGEWNHQVLKQINKDGEISFGVHEFYYNNNGEIYMVIDHPSVLSAPSLGELRELVERAADSLGDDVLDYDTFIKRSEDSQKNDDKELAEELLEMKKQIDYRYGLKRHSVDFLPRITLSVLVDDIVEGVIGKTVSLNISWITLYFSMNFTEYKKA